MVEQADRPDHVEARSPSAAVDPEQVGLVTGPDAVGVADTPSGRGGTRWLQARGSLDSRRSASAWEESVVSCVGTGGWCMWYLGLQESQR